MDRRESELVVLNNVREKLRSLYLRGYLRFARAYPFVHGIIIVPLNIRKTLISLSEENNTVYCIYDLDMLPITYNVFEYLAIFNVVAQQTKKKFHLIIIKQRRLKKIQTGTFNKSYSVDNREFRITNILTFAVRLFPNCSGYSVIDTEDKLSLYRTNIEFFPKKYNPTRYDSNAINIYDYKDLGVQFAQIEVPKYSIQVAEALVGLKQLQKLITITLRRSKYDTARNSDLSSWSKFVKYAVSEGYSVVVIPDSENPLDYHPIDSIHVRPEFAFNLELRAALYQLAQINLGVANGPLIVSTMNKRCSTLIFKIAPPGAEMGIKVYEQMGVDPNLPYFWYTNKQAQSTLYDSFENIKISFEKMVK
jgi:hypothetical protein